MAKRQSSQLPLFEFIKKKKAAGNAFLPLIFAISLLLLLLPVVQIGDLSTGAKIDRFRSAIWFRSAI